MLLNKPVRVAAVSLVATLKITVLDQPTDGAEKLLQSLYETIRDDLKEE